MRKKHVFGYLPILLLTVITLCLSCAASREEIFVDLSCLVVNNYPEEILTISTENEIAIIGFFLLPGEEYLFEYVGLIDKQMGDDDFRLPFQFYAPGPESTFTEYIGTYIFETKVSEGHVYADTFYVE